MGLPIGPPQPKDCHNWIQNVDIILNTLTSTLHIRFSRWVNVVIEPEGATSGADLTAVMLKIDTSRPGWRS